MKIMTLEELAPIVFEFDGVRIRDISRSGWWRFYLDDLAPPRSGWYDVFDPKDRAKLGPLAELAEAVHAVLKNDDRCRACVSHSGNDRGIYLSVKHFAGGVFERDTLMRKLAKLVSKQKEAVPAA